MIRDYHRNPNDGYLVLPKSLANYIKIKMYWIAEFELVTLISCSAYSIPLHPYKSDETTGKIMCIDYYCVCYLIIKIR